MFQTERNLIWGIWFFKIVEISGKIEGHITFQESAFVPYKADDQGV